MYKPFSIIAGADNIERYRVSWELTSTRNGQNELIDETNTGFIKVTFFLPLFGTGYQPKMDLKDIKPKNLLVSSLEYLHFNRLRSSIIQNTLITSVNLLSANFKYSKPNHPNRETSKNTLQPTGIIQESHGTREGAGRVAEKLQEYQNVTANTRFHIFNDLGGHDKLLSAQKGRSHLRTDATEQEMLTNIIKVIGLLHVQFAITKSIVT